MPWPCRAGVLKEREVMGVAAMVTLREASWERSSRSHTCSVYGHTVHSPVIHRCVLNFHQPPRQSYEILAACAVHRERHHQHISACRCGNMIWLSHYRPLSDSTADVTVGVQPWGQAHAWHGTSLRCDSRPAMPGFNQHQSWPYTIDTHLQHACLICQVDDSRAGGAPACCSTSTDTHASCMDVRATWPPFQV